jgi:acetyltransferase-like isoleucine patch superfamily enzyme
MRQDRSWGAASRGYDGAMLARWRGKLRTSALLALGRAVGLGRAMNYEAYRRLVGPDGRRRGWRELGAQIDDSARVGPLVVLRHPKNVSIGAGTRLGGNVVIEAWQRITIGECVLTNDHIDLLSGGHDIDDPRMRGKGAPITIGNHVWLPRRIIVMPGVTIGDCAVIGSGSVVTSSVPAYGVAVGVPARVVRERARVDYEYVPAKISDVQMQRPVSPA